MMAKQKNLNSELNSLNTHRKGPGDVIQLCRIVVDRIIIYAKIMKTLPK